MLKTNYIEEAVTNGTPLKMWVRGVPIEELARQQLANVARLPITFKHVAAMPDVHAGKGATIGSVIATKGAIIPAAVGVDIGCGMMACHTTLKAGDLPKDLSTLRLAIEKSVPHGREPGKNDPGAWGNVPLHVKAAWEELEPEFKQLCERYPSLEKTNNKHHLGTLGTGNHFIEVCIDERKEVWFMLHSGSRGVGNAIGTLFINLAKEQATQNGMELADKDLAYLIEGESYFDDYLRGVNWAQRYAQLNRELMMEQVIQATQELIEQEFAVGDMTINCHHNYVQKELHFGEEVYVTRKGAVSAKKGELGIIPGSMGERSFIVRGLGHEESFHSCSHGAGRVMSRTAAKKKFTQADHEAATQGVECRKDLAIIDETPKAYKNIDDVMRAQSDLVDIIHTLKQVVCVKG